MTIVWLAHLINFSQTDISTAVANENMFEFEGEANPNERIARYFLTVKH